MLLGPEGRKRLELRSLPNDELFRRYDPEIALRLGAPRNLHDTRKMLERFKTYLGDFPPSAGLAKAFLAQYNGFAPRTIYRYSMMIKPFMRWYGDPIDDIRIKIPRSLPQYTMDETVAKLYAAIDSKKRGRKLIERDKLIVLMGEKTGMRRAEMAHLKAGDVFEDILIVRAGKNMKDRTIPLAPSLNETLHKYIAAKAPEDLVFNLQPVSLGMVVKMYAKWAGLKEFHTHTLRDKFASDMLAAGADMQTLRILMGHENLNTTQAYMAVNPESAKIAIAKLDKKKTGDKQDALNQKNDASLINGDALKTVPVEKPEVSQQTVVEKLVIIERPAPGETEHHKQMRELARSLVGKISLPSLWDKDLWRDLPVEFKPRHYSLPIGAVEIGKEGLIKVNYKDPGAGLATPHLIGGLYSHLATSGPGFAALAGDKGNIQQWVGEVEKYYETALGFLKGIAEKIQGYDAKVNYHDAAIPGLTRWFPITIWSDAIRKAGGNAWIEDSWYLPPESLTGAGLWQLRCGAYIIGIAESLEALGKFENWHKNLRGIYAGDETAKAIAAKSQELESAAKEIRQRLQEFGDAEEILGRCKFEKNG
jgi:integrase